MRKIYLKGGEGRKEMLGDQGRKGKEEGRRWLKGGKEGEYEGGKEERKVERKKGEGKGEQGGKER